MSKWFFAIDKGGTFTDIICIDPKKKIHTSKILSQSLSYKDSSRRNKTNFEFEKG